MIFYKNHNYSDLIQLLFNTDFMEGLPSDFHPQGMNTNIITWNLPMVNSGVELTHTLAEPHLITKAKPTNAVPLGIIERIKN